MKIQPINLSAFPEINPYYSPSLMDIGKGALIAQMKMVYGWTLICHNASWRERGRVSLRSSELHQDIALAQALMEWRG